MNRRDSLSSITAGITVILLLIGATGTTSIFLNTIRAQSATLGEPYFVQKGTKTSQKELGPNRTQFSFTANGTMNGNIEVTDTGEFVSIPKVTIITLTKGRSNNDEEWA